MWRNSQHIIVGTQYHQPHVIYQHSAVTSGTPLANDLCVLKPLGATMLMD
jgi:hypothetical protein